MIKKFTTFLLAFAIVLSISTPRSSAAGGAIGTVVGSFAKYTLGAVTTELVLRAAQNGLESYFSKPQTKEFVENLIAEGIFSLTDYFAAGYTDQDIYDQFTNYNADLETDFGSYVYTSDGIIFYLIPDPKTDWTAQYFYTNGAYFKIGPWATGGTQNYVYFDDNKFVCPITGTYTAYTDVTYTYDSIMFSYGPTVKNAGGTITPPTLYLNKSSTSELYMAEGYCGFRCVPADTSALTSRIPTDSRPTSLVIPIAIQNPDETYTVYNNITLVDEGNKVVFDPTTGESITFTDWVYDYESRTYDLTLDGGGNMTVQFGNDSITMTQGDTVTNIFYVQEPADDPGTDDPDNPGTDADVSGFFAWWKNAWSGFVDRLFTVLDGGDLEVILPGEEGNPEDEEDDGWTVFDLFALIRDALWKIITGVITVVLDGFLGLVDAIASLGDFFDIYDPANPNGIFGVPDGGVDLWS